MPRTDSKPRTRKAPSSGRLRIGDDWNAINIIALSQTNPLKSVAEFVENSIDANARNITITRGRHRGEAYLRVMDDGDGVPLREGGKPDLPDSGTELLIKPLLPGIRQLNGDKIQWYLASELWDRIRQSDARIKVVDRTARKEYVVEPRRFTGRDGGALRIAVKGEVDTFLPPIGRGEAPH